MVEKHSTHKHHRERTPEEKGRDLTLEIISKGLIALAVILWIPYLAIEFIPFIRSAMEYEKINLSTMSYSALRVMLVLVPIIMIVPEKLYFKVMNLKKIKLLSRWFIGIAFFFFTGVVVDIMSYNVFGGYQDFGEDPIYIKMLWGSVSLWGITFCVLQCICYLVLWRKINGHKKQAVIAFAVTYALYMILPILSGVLTGADFTVNPWNIWLSKNIWFFLTNALVLAGLIVSAQSRRVWSSLIWR